MAAPNSNPPSGLGAFFQELEQLFHENVPDNLHDLPHRIFDSLDKLTGEVYEAVNAFGPPSISLPLPPFLSIEDGAKTISVPSRPPPPPPSVYDRVAKYTSDHPYIVTSGALGVAALGVGLGYALQDEDSFLRVTTRNWMDRRAAKEADGKRGYKLNTGSESGTSFLAGLRGGKTHHSSFAQRRADRLKGHKVDGMLKDAILILAPSPFPSLLVPLILSLLNNDYIVFVAVPKSKDADELERKIKANEKVKAKGLSVAVRVMVYDPAESASLEPFQRSLWASLTLRYPSSALSFAPSGRATHPPGDPYAPEPTHLASLHSIISLYALHPSPDPSLGTGGRLPAIPSFIHAPGKNSAGQVIERSTGETMSASSAGDQLPSLITLHHSMGILPIPTNFAEQLLTITNLLLAKNVGIANPAMRITNVGIGEIDYYSSIVAHSFTQAGATHDAEPAVMRFLKPFWTGLKMVWGFVGLGEQAGDWKVVERKLLWIVKKKRSGEYNVGRSTLLPSFLTSIFRPTIVSLLLKYTDLAALLPRIQRISANPASASTSAGSSATFTSPDSKPQPGVAATFTPSTSSFPGSASGSDGAEVDSSEFEESSVHTGTGSGGESLRGSGYVGMDGSWVGVPADV